MKLLVDSYTYDLFVKWCKDKGFQFLLLELKF